MKRNKDGRSRSHIPPGFVLNIHPTYIPFKLVDEKMGHEIPAKYIQIFLNSDNPYTYGKMTNNRPTFISKILVAPDTNMWGKPNYTCEDLQYFMGK